MLINKWLVIDSFNSKVYRDWSGGFCLDLYYEAGELSDLYKELQKLPPESPFTIVLPGKNSQSQNLTDAYIENIIALFFQPSYYLTNGKPVVFISDDARNSEFIEKLSEKSVNQGLHLSILKTKSVKGTDHKGSQFAYAVTSADIDYDALVEGWLSLFLENKNPGEIHFLFEKNDPDLLGIVSGLREKELSLFKTRHYKFASIAYHQQALIDKYKGELDIKKSVEKNMQNYLSLQKKQTADNVEWYHNEYEILPTWYKRIGHVIKVFMGKRTFRSLFSDKVKKYND
jgi:hypothetical protein